MKKYLVLGASPNPDRFSYKAVTCLIRKNKEVIPVGFRQGNISGIEILTGFPPIKEVDALLLYLGAKNQERYIDYILEIKPGKVIFNPGSENPNLAEVLKKAGIEVVFDCAIILIDSNRL